MKLSATTSTLRAIKADAVAVFLPQDKKEFDGQVRNLRKFLGNRIDTVIDLEQFKGKEGECVSLYTERKLSAPRLLLIGIGEEKKRSLETYRRAAATAQKKAKALKAKQWRGSIPR